MEDVPGRLSNYPKVTLMVTHAAPFVALVRAFLGNNKASLFPGTCGLVKLVRVDGEEEKVATEEGWEIAFDGTDCPHLSSGSMWSWGYKNEQDSLL